MEIGDLFEYDLWANRLWSDCLPNQAAKDVFHHIVWAQWVWAQRVSGSPLPEVSGDALSEVERMGAVWRRLIADTPHAAVIEYRSLSGEPFSNTFLEIATHVANHGTYHRGQLREIAEQASVPFPETDVIRWLRVR